MVPRVLKLETDIHGMDRPISVLNRLHRLRRLHRLDAALLEGGPLEESLEGLGGWLAVILVLRLLFLFLRRTWDGCGRRDVFNE
jgi:hypothetical protein